MVPALSLRSVALCVLLGFSTNVSAIAAVLGIDLGTEYIKAALVKPGIPLDIVLTKDSRRKEISAVTFKPSRSALGKDEYPERAYGSDAVALSARFPGDVYPNLKTLLGLSTDHEIAAEYLAKHPALQVEAHKTRGTVAFKSKAFSTEEEAWMIEELLAMELQSIQRNAEDMAGSGSSVRSVVITVPPFFTIQEKRAVELAAELVGLKVLSLISDGLAVGLNYATSRTFPTVSDGQKPEQHMVFDMGAGSAKATIMKFQGRVVKDVGKFNKTVQEIQVMGSGWDRTLGGDSLNYLIVEDMLAKFVESPAAKKVGVAVKDVEAHGRAMAKLVKDAEKIRHVLSANTETSASFEGLYEDIDFRYKITRADFEKLAEAHAERVDAVIKKALETADLDISQLDSIILHGGASRTPFVQKQLEKIAGADKLRSNVNSDEAAVFGAGFRAAEISPSFRVKEIRVFDGAFYPVGIKWSSPHGRPNQQRLWNQRSLLGAAPKEVTFANHADFPVSFFQQLTSSSGLVDQEMQVMTTKNLTDSVASLIEKNGCADADIQFKVQLKLNMVDGDVEVVRAAVECEADAEKEGIMDGVKNLFGFGKKDQQPLKEGEKAEAVESESATESAESAESSSTESSSTTGTSSGTAAAAESSPAAKKKVTVVIPVDFTLEKTGAPELSKTEFTTAKNRLKAFESSDRARRLREETLNQLEGFTYKIRDLLEKEDFIAASTDKERTLLEKKAHDASEWLYEDGADASHDTLRARLKQLKDIVNPIEKRVGELAERPQLVQKLQDALSRTNSFVENIKEKIAEAEAYASSVSASVGSSSTSEAESTVTSAPSEDASSAEGDASSSTTTASSVVDDRGPIPPLYTLDDLKEITELAESTAKWLKEKLTAQDKLPDTANPVLLIKDITEKTKQLEKAGMDLAMKSVKNFDKKNKKKSSSTKKSKTKSSTKTATGEGSAPTLDFDNLKAEDLFQFNDKGERINKEDMEALLQKMKQFQAENKDGKAEAETEAEAEAEKPSHDEL
ncbi:Hsp70 protein-domain-containing protein [Microdochium trichocladiopsis]|uniref:Hsp70 protein-domain-containing protein n=1 Tax=Microdochium trichocladiopsis TaxID=1682393 RepID=A0A9P8YKJ5_9PEZI|nr:Hsp70 protein-domain-containing protein [Microdochium trichocladiopsis]KAH7040705.1 Hsp70 protein-domain-containing protein [Microdochium trichocladiopsis]